MKAPILLRAFPIINDLLPLKIKQAQEATKMHIRTLAADLVREEMATITSNSASSKNKSNGTTAVNGNGNGSSENHGDDDSDSSVVDLSAKLGRHRDDKNLLSHMSELSKILYLFY